MTLQLLQRADADKRPKFRLTARDKEIIKAVYEHQALTTAQIRVRLFPDDTLGAEYGKMTKCHQRLRLLFHHGYLHRTGELGKPLIYRIDRRALEELPAIFDVEPEEIDWEPKYNSKGVDNHLLVTNDVRIAIELAAQHNEMVIRKWLNERTLKKLHSKIRLTIPGKQGGTSEKAGYEPDGYFHLWTGKLNLHHLLEVDLGNESGQATKLGRKDFERKIKASIAFIEDGHFERMYNAKGARVLIATTSQRRVATLKRITEEVGGKHRFWFTSFDLLRSETVFTEPIWQVATKQGSEVLIW